MCVCVRARACVCVCCSINFQGRKCTWFCNNLLLNIYGLIIMQVFSMKVHKIAKKFPQKFMIAVSIFSSLSLIFGVTTYTATASSHFSDHSAQQAVDGVVTSETCYWSEPSVSSWWELDLGVDVAISKIRITNTVCMCVHNLCICSVCCECVCLCVLHVCLSVHLSVCLSIQLSVCLPVRLFLCTCSNSYVTISAMSGPKLNFIYHPSL